MQPSVSILVCTYGRTSLLAECIESFRRQDYAGQLELIVINDCPHQTLTCDDARVRIVNAEKPYDSYANKRNVALAVASNDMICLWDDDDIYLPSFVSKLAAKLEDGDIGARLSRLMKWDGRIASVISGAQYHTAMLSTADVRRIGGWRNEPITDADFARRLVQYRFFHGARQNTDDGLAPLMVYRNDPERVHMEGGSNTRITREQFMDAMNRRIYTAKEPGGAIDIAPTWTQDWVAFVSSHLPAVTP